MAVHRYSSASPIPDLHAASNPLGPFAMREAFPRSDYYGPSAPPHSHRLTTRQPDPAPQAEKRRLGSRTAVPTFTANRSRSEAPSYAPAISPRLRRRIHRGLQGERP